MGRYRDIQKKKKWSRRLVLILAVLAAGLLITLLFGDRLWQALFRKAGLSMATAPASAASANETALHFINIGQGDAVLIQQGESFCLIDTGEMDNQADLLAYLDSLALRKLDLLVMTHPHGDHIGGMEAVMERYKVGMLLMPDLTGLELEEAYLLQRVLNTAQREGVPVQIQQAGASYPVGNGALDVLCTGILDEDTNDISPVLRYVDANLSFIDTGDATANVEQKALAAGVNLRADVFKAGHHGSSGSNTLEFMQAVQPKFVVASCGLNNDYGHPHAGPLRNFVAVGAQVYRTDLDGSVVVLGSAKGLQVFCQKDAAAA